MSSQALPSVAGGGGAGTPASSVVTETTFGAASAVGTSTDYARADHTHGTPSLPALTAGIYGNGGDGSLTVVGTYTATTERQFSSVTIPAGTAFKPAGYRIFVNGTLTIAATGSFNDDGNAASGITAGGALTSRAYLGGAAGGGGAKAGAPPTA